MNLRLAFILSLFLHILPALIFYISESNEIKVSVKKGVSSIQISFNNPSQTFASINKKSFSEKISSKVITGNKPNWKTAYGIKKSSSKNMFKSNIDLLKIKGALSKRAEQLSRNSPPEYPYLARKYRYHGKVTLKIEILPSGLTGKVLIIESSGYEILDNAAISAVKNWIFFEKEKLSLTDSLYISRNFIFKLSE